MNVKRERFEEARRFDRVRKVKRNISHQVRLANISLQFEEKKKIAFCFKSEEYFWKPFFTNYSSPSVIATFSLSLLSKAVVFIRLHPEFQRRFGKGVAVDHRFIHKTIKVRRRGFIREVLC